MTTPLFIVGIGGTLREGSTSEQALRLSLAHAAHLVGGEDPFLHYLRQGAVAGLALRSTAEQELAEAPALRYQVLNTALIDWQAQAARPRTTN